MAFVTTQTFNGLANHDVDHGRLVQAKGVTQRRHWHDLTLTAQLQFWREFLVCAGGCVAEICDLAADGCHH